MASLYHVVDDLRNMLFGEHQTEQSQEKMRESIRASLKNGHVDAPPQYLMLKVTNRCNSNCFYCGHAANRTAQEAKSEIALDVLRSAIQQAADLGVSAATMSGGEPLLREDIPDLTAYMLSHGIVPVLLTNGLLLSQKWEELGVAGLRYLIISIDSLDPDVYRLQRGAEVERAILGLRAAQEMRERYDDVKIHITAVVTKHNIAELPSLVRAMSKEKIAVQFSPYHHYNHLQDDVLSPQDEIVVNTAVRELLLLKEEGLYVAGTAEFISHIPDFFLHKKRIPQNYHCLAGHLAMFVDAYSNVLPCWSSRFQPVGNLADRNLKEIWYSDVYAQNRKRMFNCACEGCWYLCTGELTTLCNEGECIYGRTL